MWVTSARPVRAWSVDAVVPRACESVHARDEMGGPSRLSTFRGVMSIHLLHFRAVTDIRHDLVRSDQGTQALARQSSITEV